MKKNERPPFRDVIGLVMIFLSIGLLIALSVNGFYIISKLSDNNEKFKDIQSLFGILLPLIGTWVGTVLAYYFSKENFAAASQSVSNLVKHITSTEEKLKEIKVADVMLKPENFKYRLVKTEDDFYKSLINEINEEMKDKKVERYPVLLEKSLQFVFLFYRSTLERFMMEYVKEAVHLSDKSKSVKFDKLTVHDMFESDFQLIKDIKELTDKKKFISVNASLEEVRELMQDNSICQDIFITKTGDKSEGVEGWMTNEIVIEKSDLFKKVQRTYL